MADTLLFRGGSSADIAVSTVQNRELVIDTDTDQIVSGTSKKKTVMEDSSGNVEIGGGNIELNADGTAKFDGAVVVGSPSYTPLQKLHVSTGTTGGAGLVGIALGSTTSSGRSAAIIKDTDAPYSLRINASNNVGVVAGDLIFGDAYKERARVTSGGNFILGGTLPSSPNIELNTDGTATFAGNVTASATGDSDNQVFLDSRGAILAFRETTASTWSSLSSSSSVVPSAGYQILAGGNYNAGTRVATSWINSNGSAYFQDQVGIGGTLPASPNIELNADGSITATRSTAGTVFTGRVVSGANSANYRFYADDTTNGVTLFSYGSAYPGSSYLDVGVNGSALFANGGHLGIIAGTDKELRFGAGNSLAATFDSSRNFLIGPNSASPNISLNADGTGTFGSSSSKGGVTITGPQGSGNRASNPLIQLTATGPLAGNSDDTIWITEAKNDGSLQFDSWQGGAWRSPYAVSFSKAGGISANGDVLIGGTLPSAPNITLNADGSSIFALDATINGLTVGMGGGSVDSNTAVGGSALQVNTTGTRNTAVGQSALRFNTGGINNSTIGRASLYSNTTGNNNTAIGSSAGYYIEGSNNTILGAYTGTSADATLSNTVIISAGTTERARCDSNGDWDFGSIILKSPNGTSFRLSVANDGTLSATSI